ncbi:MULTISPECIES: hypothetical protein [Sphingobacterium]|uniref:hypothetical protein n=1 Tax=Sphingobacterium sp. UME9 TaxID=1862316 RepID=UPI0016001459|nr:MULTISPECIES: hypothetical protein [Sphingobacterium]QQT33071.1 hypothetical protein I6I99_11085 [Sphingobacterium multivorum]
MNQENQDRKVYLVPTISSFTVELEQGIAAGSGEYIGILKTDDAQSFTEDQG